MNETRTIAFVAAVAVALLTLTPSVGNAATQDGAHTRVALSQDHKSSVRADPSEQTLDTCRPAHPQTSATRDRAEGGAVQD